MDKGKQLEYYLVGGFRKKEITFVFFYSSTLEEKEASRKSTPSKQQQKWPYNSIMHKHQDCKTLCGWRSVTEYWKHFHN